MMHQGYDTAQICPNGHVVTCMAGSGPDFRQHFCAKCGEATLMECPKCKSSIRGHYHSPGVIGFYDSSAPSFCHNCGNPFPWTERKQQAAIDLFIEETQNEEERKEFRDCIQQIAKDTPQAQVASKKITRLLKNIGKETASAIRDIVVDVASETAKKLLVP